MKLPKLNVIYAPTGRASEYSELALNIYNGCTHGCKYCYCNEMAKKWSNNNFHDAARPKANVVEKVKKDIIRIKKIFGDAAPNIMLSFSGDVYQPVEAELGLTRQVIELLVTNNLFFSILTKGGSLAARDFDLLSEYSRCSFGTTIVFTKLKDAEYWEPGSASIIDRIKTIKKAHDLGIKTWVSLEPVIYPRQALLLVEKLHPVVNHWKVGRLNHQKPPKPVDWLKFRKDVKKLLDSLGASYYLKRSLSKL